MLLSIIIIVLALVIVLCLALHRSPLLLNSKAFGYKTLSSAKYREIPTETWTRPSDLKKMVNSKSPGIIWIRLSSDSVKSDVGTFARSILPSIKHSFYLVTTDGDLEVPGKLDVRPILESKFLLGWFTQNLGDPNFHPKLRHFPIGLDLHSGLSISKKEELFRKTAAAALPWEKRRKLVLFDVGSFSHPDRRTALLELEKKSGLVDIFRKRVSFEKAIRIYSEYKYGVVVRGNGHDTHRFWEFVGLGLTPIVVTGPLDALYSLNGINVVILKKWSDLTLGILPKPKKPNGIRLLNPSIWLP